MNSFSGGYCEEATPDPIPNSEVKLLCADGTAWRSVWESRSPPDPFLTPRGFHAPGRFLFVGPTVMVSDCIDGMTGPRALDDSLSQPVPREG